MQFSPAWAYSHTYYTSALNMNCPEPLIIKLLVQQIHRVLLWQLKGDTDIEHMHLVGKMHLVGGGGQMCLNCTVLKTALCRCSCLSSALRYLLANENQSEVSFHYAQWHNPHLCNSLLKSLLLVFPRSWRTSNPTWTGLYSLAASPIMLPPNFLPLNCCASRRTQILLTANIYTKREGCSFYTVTLLLLSNIDSVTAPPHQPLLFIPSVKHVRPVSVSRLVPYLK